MSDNVLPIQRQLYNRSWASQPEFSCVTGIGDEFLEVAVEFENQQSPPHPSFCKNDSARPPHGGRFSTVQLVDKSFVNQYVHMSGIHCATRPPGRALSFSRMTGLCRALFDNVKHTSVAALEGRMA